MKKLTLFFALLVTSNLWATIIYEKNGGKFNDYDWENKGDMFAACMADGGVTGLASLDEVKALADPFAAICTPLQDGNVTTLMSLQKWDWLEEYILTAQNAQKGNAVASSTVPGLTAGTASAAWRYAIAAFFLETQKTGWPYSADFSEAGKDAAYIPAWGQNYGNPTDPTEEVTLVAPYRAGYLFDGWYDNEACTGTPITKVNQNTTGTLYAKWVLDGIVYELNGGKYNDYGWTSKADICYGLQADYNSAYSKSLSWAKKENGVVYYNIAGTWMTETEAKGQEANVDEFLQATTYNTTKNLLTIVEDTHKTKYGWLKDVIVANRQAQGLGITIDEALYRKELSAFFLCSPKNTSYPTNSSYETTGDYEDFQPYWGQVFPNPEHPTAEVVLNNPVKAGYKFLGWYDNEACTGTPITKVDQNTKGTLYAKWVLEGIVYELNGGVWNEYGWTSKDDMYSALLKDINEITPPTQKGTDVNTITLAVDKQNAVSKGIPTYWSDLTVLLTHTAFNEKWGWLIAYMDEACEAQGKEKPSSSSTYLRYNLGAFFVESDASTYLHAQYGSLGKDAAYIPAWGQSYGNPEHPTAEVELYAPIKARYAFVGWYANEDFSGEKVTKVNADYAGTLYAKWTGNPITYELNGGQYNEYGWESKAEICLDLNKDYQTTYNSKATWAVEQSGVILYNIDNAGTYKTDFDARGQEATIAGFIYARSYNTSDNLTKLIANNADKYSWIKDIIIANRSAQGYSTELTEQIYRYELSAFFLHSPKTANSSSYENIGDLPELQSYCSFTLPNPMYPTKEVTLNNPTKEGYIFDGWYANADFSGAKVTKVNADTKGTLYAKWKEDAYSRTVTNGNYGTICLPKGSKQTSGAIFYELACKDAQYVYLDQVTILEAGVPYIFKATSNTLKVVYNATEVTEAGDYNGLYGTFVEIQDAATSDPNNVLEGNYLLVSNTIKKCGVNCKVLENRAYIKLEEIPNSASAAPGRNRVSMKYEGENEATGLDNITEDSNIAPALQGTYDIMGRKLTEPSATGFYIVNGKKVIIVK